MPGAGIEPARPEGREILSLLRLPVSPPGLGQLRPVSDTDGEMEAETGIEPMSTALQAAA